jgi:predicted dehydrogenase
MNRREFLKTAGVGAGVALATGCVRTASGATQKVRVGCIGTGGQGSFHLRTGLAGAQNIEVVAVCDVYNAHLDLGWKNAGGETRTVTKYMDYREMLDKEELDAVVISTPLPTHFQITMDCLDAGKYVFCEKTLCYTIEDCRKIVQKCHETGLFCQVGHQRRYNPKYNKALWLQREKGMFGRINHITMQWHRNDPWRRFVDPTQVLSAEEQKYIPDIERHLNWRLYTATSGGLMTELSTHQSDVANWFMGTPPSRVWASGGLDYWRDGREIEDNVAVTYEYEIRPDNKAGFAAVQPRNPFVDKRQLNRPYKVRATFTSTTATGKCGASELYQGDKGSVSLTEENCFLFQEPNWKLDIDQMAKWTAMNAGQSAEAITSGKSRQVPTEAYTKGVEIRVFNEKPVDQLQFEAFANDIMNKGMPKANQMVGLMTAVAGLAGLESLREGGKVVDIDPAWYAFDFETPDPYRFENWPGPDDPPQNGQPAAPAAAPGGTATV